MNDLFARRVVSCFYVVSKCGSVSGHVRLYRLLKPGKLNVALNVALKSSREFFSNDELSAAKLISAPSSSNFGKRSRLELLTSLALAYIDMRVAS